MKTTVTISLFLSLLYSVTGVVIKNPDVDGSEIYPHLTGMFGPRPLSFSISGSIVSEPTLLCTPIDYSVQYHNKIVMVERGSCSFTTKALNAQKLGAVGVIIGNNYESDILFMMGTDSDYMNDVTIPTVFISGNTYASIKQAVEQFSSSDGLSITATLNDQGETNLGFPTASPPSQPVSPPSPPVDSMTGYPASPEPAEETVDSRMTIIWTILGASLLLKCLIITLACRRRYGRSSSSSARSTVASSSSSSVPLTEGDVSDEGELPVVYATYPAPSAAFTVSASAPTPSSSASVSVPRNLSMYPSVQYSPLLPQATAPSDVYVHDLEKQAIIIRG